ncbi:hypothetical protein ACI6Q2_08870 [Chitinophagaceae bacterium LWZ2-11]
MKPIQSVLKQGNQGDEVMNLHYILFFIKQKLNNPGINRLFDDAGFISEYKKDVYKKLYDNATTKWVVIFQQQLQIQNFREGVLDELTANRLNNLLREFGGLGIDKPEGYPFEISGSSNNGNSDSKYKVSGFVTNKNGEFLKNQTVIAYDIDLKGVRIYKIAQTIDELNANNGLQLLGSTITGEDGGYSISFSANQFNDAEMGPADVVCYVAQSNADGRIVITGRSAMTKDSDYIDGLSVENWNIVLDDVAIKGESEYSKLVRIVDPFMQASGLNLYEIADSPDQIEFLANELKQDPVKISLLVNAATLNKEMQRDISSRELFYGLGKQSVKLDWLTISETGVAASISCLRQSFNSNSITVVANSPREADNLIVKFAQDLHDYAVQKNLNDSATQPNGIKNILSTAIKNNDVLMQNFYKGYINRTGSPQEFWKTLREDETFKNNVDSLLMTNRLSALTINNANVMQRLITKIPDNDVTKLMELTNDEWNTAIDTDIPDFISGSTLDEKKNNYREFMSGQLNAAFYNEKVSLMVKNENEINISDQGIRDKLNTFLTTTKFDLRYNRLYDKVVDSTTTFQEQLERIGGEQKETLNEELNKIQRVFQFSPSPEIMTKLLASGIDSATMVASMPYTTFKEKYKDVGDEQILLSIHQRASHIVSMIEYSILSLNKFSQSAKIPAIAGK